MDEKIKRLMNHANIDESTAKDALEKNNDNVLDAFAYLEKEKIIDGKVSEKEIKNEKKKSVEYNPNHRYMDSNPQKPTKTKSEKNVETKKSEVLRNEKKDEEKPKQNVSDVPELKHYSKGTSSYEIPTPESTYNKDYYPPSNYDVQQYKDYTDPNFKNVGRQIVDWFMDIFNYLITTKLIIMRRNNVIISVPIIIAIVVAIAAHFVVLPLFIVSLFFSFRYFVESENISGEDLENRVKNTYKYEERKKAANHRRPPYMNQRENQPYGGENASNSEYSRRDSNYTYYYNNNQERSQPDNEKPQPPTENNVGYYSYGGYTPNNSTKYYEETNKFQGKNNIIDIENNKKE